MLTKVNPKRQRCRHDWNRLRTGNIYVCSICGCRKFERYSRDGKRYYQYYYRTEKS